jgi:hemolysin D
VNANRSEASGAHRGRSVRGRVSRARTGVVMRSFQPHVLAIEETPAAPFSSILLWSMVALLLFLLTWAWIGHIPIMTSAPGKFVSDARIKVVQSLNVGTVSGILVRPGDRVLRGQVLVALSPRVDREKYVSAERSLSLDHLQIRRALYELGETTPPGKVPGTTVAMESMESHLAEAQAAAERSKIADDHARVEEAEANVAAGEASLNEDQQRLRQDRDLARAAEKVVDEGAISGQDYIKLEIAVTDDQGDVASETNKVAELQAAVRSAQNSLASDIYTFAVDRYKDLEAADTRKYGLSSDYAQAGHSLKMDSLRSPIAGFVQSVAVASLGTVVESGQTIATIEPLRAPLMVEADVPSRDIGFVKVGQTTRIKVTAYPFEQYGSISGTVIWISPSAEPTSNLAALPIGESHEAETPAATPAPSSAGSESAASPPPTLYYRIKVQPARAWLNVEGARREMRPGMTATVDVTTGHRRVLDFFLDPLIKYAKSGMVVR